MYVYGSSRVVTAFDHCGVTTHKHTALIVLTVYFVLSGTCKPQSYSRE